MSVGYSCPVNSRGVRFALIPNTMHVIDGVTNDVMLAAEKCIIDGSRIIG